MAAKTFQQHEPLRKPQGWNQQEAAFVMQLERLLTDIYRQLTILDEKVKELSDRVSALEE